MTKRISVWLTAVLVVFACAITFQLTVVFGSGFVREEPVGTVPTEFTTTAPEAEPEPPTPEEERSAYLHGVLDELLGLYERYFIGDLDTDALASGIAAGLSAYSGDKYGAYHDVEELEELMIDYAGEFAGIGVSVLLNTDYYAIEVITVMPNSPALEADLRPGDLIVAVAGEDVAALGYNEAVNRIRGEIGTDVTLTIARGDNYEEAFDVTLTRRLVEEQTVTYETIEMAGLVRPIALIRINSFDAKTPEQFADALGLGQSERVHGYIIDVRNNGGGELNSIVSILDMLLPEGPIIRVQYKDGTEEVKTSDAQEFDEPIVVLCNERTASAAELFVAALRDYQKGIIVGETTYGKGTVQSILPLSTGAGLRLSIAMYLPPFGDNFEGVGVTPHIEASLADEYKNLNLYKVAYENDAQLQAALDLYK